MERRLNVGGEVDVHDFGPAGGFTRLYVVGGVQKVIDHVGLGKRLVLLFRHAFAGSSHKIAKDKGTTGFDNSESFSVRLGLGERMHISVLTKGKVKGVFRESSLVVSGRDDLKAFVDLGVRRTLESGSVLFVAKIDARNLGDLIAQGQVPDGSSSATTTQVDVSDLFWAAEQFQSMLEHVIGHGITGLSVSTLSIQVNAVPLSKVNVGGTCLDNKKQAFRHENGAWTYLSPKTPTPQSELTIPHHLSVKVTLFGSVVLFLDTIKMLLDVSGLAVDLGSDSVGS